MTIVVTILFIILSLIGLGFFIRGIILFYKYRKFKRLIFLEAEKILDAGSPELAYRLLEQYPTNFGQWLMEISYRIKNG